MADLADQSDANAELYTREALYLHSLRMQQAPETLDLCEHCEENPPETTMLMVKLRYCSRCAEELELTNI